VGVNKSPSPPCLGQGFFDQIRADAPTFQAGYQFRHRIGIQSLQVLSQALAHVGPDQLVVIAREAEPTAAIREALRGGRTLAAEGTLAMTTYSEVP